jgi:hypothetical protein
MNKITFLADSKHMLNLLERPIPAIKKLPNWIQNTPSYINNTKGVDHFNDPDSTVKKCMPVMDSMTAGYYILTHSDIWVENKGPENFMIRWAWDTIKVIEVHKKEQLQLYPTPEGYCKTPFKFLNPWIIKTKKQWSSFLTHPLHYDDLPFRCVPAIVDTDKHPIPINFIFFIKNGFSGLIPKGTPIMQVIPFKRENCKSEFSYDKGKLKLEWEKAYSVFFDRYKRFFRSPKKYEQGDIRKCPFHFNKD